MASPRWTPCHNPDTIVRHFKASRRSQPQSPRPVPTTPPPVHPPALMTLNPRRILKAVLTTLRGATTREQCGVQVPSNFRRWPRHLRAPVDPFALLYEYRHLAFSWPPLSARGWSGWYYFVSPHNAIHAGPSRTADSTAHAEKAFSNMPWQAKTPCSVRTL